MRVCIVADIRQKIADGKYSYCKFIDISEEYEGLCKRFF